MKNIINFKQQKFIRKARYQTKYPDKYASELLTYEYKLQILYEGICHYVATKEYDKALRLIEVSNKMQGHYAPEESKVTMNITLTATEELIDHYAAKQRETVTSH